MTTPEDRTRSPRPPRTRPANSPPAAAAVGIRAGELLSREALMQRLGIGRKAWATLQAKGLQTVKLTGRSWVLGSEVLRLFAKLQAEQNGEASKKAADTQAGNQH